MVQQNRMLFVSCYTVGSGRYYCCVLFFFRWVTLTKWPSIALFKKTTQPTFENVFYTVLFFPCVFFYFKPSFDLVDHLQDHIALGGMEFTVNKVKNPWYNNNCTLFFWNFSIFISAIWIARRTLHYFACFFLLHHQLSGTDGVIDGRMWGSGLGQN